MQCEKGGQNARRSKYAVALERNIFNSLQELRLHRDIVLRTNYDLQNKGYDPEIFNLIFPGWERVDIREHEVIVTWGTQI